MRHNNFNMDDALMELSRTYGRGALGAGLHSDTDPTNWGGALRMDEGSGPAPAGPQFNTGIPPNLHFTGADATGNRYGAGPTQVPFNPPVCYHPDIDSQYTRFLFSCSIGAR